MDDTSSFPLKRCIKCGDNFPATREFFYANKDTYDGLLPRCKTCHHLYHKPRPVLPHGHKYCPGCQQSYPATAKYFGVCKTRSDGISPFCKACQRKKNTEQYAKKKTQESKQDVPESMICSDCGENKSFTADYFRKNPRSRYGLLTRCKDCERIYARRFKRTTQDRENQILRRRTPEGRMRMIATQENRRARKFGIPGSGITLQDLQQKYQSQEGKCYYCSKPLDTTFELDHMHPIVHNGLHEPNNCALACRWCNRSKGGKTMQEWLPYLEKFVLNREV